MSLLHFCFNNRNELGIGRVAACHLNHGLRGKESDEDERCVREYCKCNGIELYSENAHMSDSQDGMNGLENRAREIRYAFFERAALQSGADLIATAHTASDNAETFLFRIARGTSVRGASSIPARRGRYVRPLLCVSRAEVEDYCRECGILYRTDSTNLEDGCARNVIRHHVLPELNRVNSASLRNIDAFVDSVSRITGYMDRATQEHYSEFLKNGCISAGGVLSLDTVLRDHLFSRLLEHLELRCDRKCVEGMEKVLQKGGKYQISGDWYALLRKKNLYIEKISEAAAFSVPLGEGAILLPGGRRVLISRHTQDVHKKFENHLFKICFDCDKVIGELILRNRSAGDVFVSAVRKQAKPLKKIFNERGYSAQQRSEILVISDDHGIVWLEGEGPSKRTAVTPGTKKYFKVDIT